MAEENGSREKFQLVVVGHVDHGKSTVVGRLLADTHTLPEGKLEQLKEYCARNSRPFEYAFLIDALKDEQAQGITIDAARVFFRTPRRDYIIHDAPGHIEFLKNMVTGASRAEAAVLVIDAEEGVRENSRRHGTMLSLLGIRQLVVAVNKMDRVGYQEQVFKTICLEYGQFLSELGIEAGAMVPVSGMEGDNLAHRGARMTWYSGATLLEVIEGFQKEKPAWDLMFRLPVQDVYRFTRYGDKRRIVAGTAVSGEVRPGDELIFYPSGKKSRVATIEQLVGSAESARAGQALGLTLEEQIYIRRGEMAARSTEPAPAVSTRFRCSLFWLGQDSLSSGKEYTLKLGSTAVPCFLEAVEKRIDASTLDSLETRCEVRRHDVAECILRTARPVAFDPVDVNPATSRFVIVDNCDIRGGGIIRQACADSQSDVRDKVIRRDQKWEKGRISRLQRAEKYNQRPTLILITGNKNTGRKTLAKRLEERLFHDGKLVYFLGIGNVLYGVDADIKGQDGKRREHIRRLGEVSNLLLDAGLLLIVTAVEITEDEIEILKTIVGRDTLFTVWNGPGHEGRTFDYFRDDAKELDDSVQDLMIRLQEMGLIFKPW